jgi:antitoxin ParD1/3/4
LLSFAAISGELKLKLVTVLLPEAYLKGLEKLVDEGLYPSKSASIRFAVNDLLRTELWRREAGSTKEEASAKRKVRMKHAQAAIVE